VVLSGGGSAGLGESFGFGDDPVNAVAGGRSGNSTPADRGNFAAAGEGGTDSGETSEAGVGGIGGAISERGGTTGAGGSGAGGHTAAAVHALVFSEYIEGSSANKALEIYARADSSLEDCKVGAYFNGSAEASVVASLSGSLAAGKVLTLCTSTLKEKLGSACNQVGRLTFNGNDAVALECEGKLLDVIGQIGKDPGASWGSAGVTTIDHTLRRKCSVSAGDPNGTDLFTPANEWLGFPIDTFNGLGTRGC